MGFAAIAELFDYGYPIWHDEDYKVVVTWNGSATFNLWEWNLYGFSNTDVCTVYPDTFSPTLDWGQEKAQNWINELFYETMEDR